MAEAAEQSIEHALGYLDRYGGERDTAEATIALPRGRYLNVRAGGPETHSTAGGTGFTHFEVLLDHEPPRFWTRYGGSTSLFAQVPRLLVAHHVVRSGGPCWIALEKWRTEQARFLQLSLALAPGTESAVMAALRHMNGVSIKKMHASGPFSLRTEV